MQRWGTWVFAVLFGVAFGVGSYTFYYAKGGSYLLDDPAACANCHVMSSHYNAWMKSSHRAVATCNSCHTPAGFFAKYYVKAENGYRHSMAFTSGKFIEPIRITERNRKVAEQSCRKCHQELVESIEGTHEHAESIQCLHCHQGVGHSL